MDMSDLICSFVQSLLSKAKAKTLSKTKTCMMFDQAKNNIFDLVKKYEEKYEIAMDFEEDMESDNEEDSIKYPIDKDHIRKNLLHYACQHNNYDMITYLIDHGCDINSEDLNGKRPFSEYLSHSFPPSEFENVGDDNNFNTVCCSFFENNLSANDTPQNNYLILYLHNKTIKHSVYTLELFVYYYIHLTEEKEKDPSYLKLMNEALIYCIENHFNKDIITFLVSNEACLTSKDSKYNKYMLPYADSFVLYKNTKNKSTTTQITPNPEYIHGINLIIKEGICEYPFTITSDRLLPEPVAITCLKQFEIQKSYLSTHSRTLSETQETSMFDAAKKGDFSVALEFDKEGYDIITCSSVKDSILNDPCTNEYTCSILLYACLHDRLDLIQEFIDKGVSLFSIFNNECILSQYICLTSKFNPAVATLLIENGVDVDSCDVFKDYCYSHNFTPLPLDVFSFFKQHRFSLRKNSSTLLLESTIDHFLDSTSSHLLDTSLMTQMKELNIDLNNIATENPISYLYTFFNQQNIDPLVFQRNVDCLINIGTETNPKYTSLKKSSRNDYQRSLLIEYLFQFRNLRHRCSEFKHVLGDSDSDTTSSNIDTSTIDTSITPEQEISIITKCLETIVSNIQYLVSCGASVTTQYNNKTILFYCLDIVMDVFSLSKSITQLCKKLMKFFIDHKVNIDHTDKNGMNVLMYYIVGQENTNPSIITMFIELGLDLNSHNPNDGYMTPLSYALHRKHPLEIIKHLVTSGTIVKPNRKYPSGIFLYLDVGYTRYVNYPSAGSAAFERQTKNKFGKPLIDSKVLPKPEVLKYLLSVGHNALETFNGLGLFNYYIKFCLDSNIPIDDEIIEILVKAGLINDDHEEKTKENINLKKDLSYRLIRNQIEKLVYHNRGKKDDSIFTLYGMKIRFISKDFMSFSLTLDNAFYNHDFTPLDYFILNPTFNRDTVRAAQMVEYLLQHGAKFRKADKNTLHLINRHYLSMNVNIDVSKVLLKHFGNSIWNSYSQPDFDDDYVTTNIPEFILNACEPFLLSTLLASGADFLRDFNYNSNQIYNLLNLSVNNNEYVIPRTILKFITTYYRSGDVNLKDNPEEKVFQKYQVHDDVHLVAFLMTFLLTQHPDRIFSLKDRYYKPFANLRYKLEACIDYSFIYPHYQVLEFAFNGCEESECYTEQQNANTLVFYYKVMELVNVTTNRQHQVRRLKKHLLCHNRSLYHSASTGSVRSCVSEDYSVVKMLHERYYNTALVLHPVDHTSVLMYAAKQGLIPMVKWAISLGANVNAVDGKGMTALMYCCKYSQKYEVIELLLWHGADVGVEWKNRYTAFDMLYRNGVE